MPAVFAKPIMSPAYFGAMSMWLSAQPPRENAAQPNASDAVIEQVVALRELGIISKPNAVPSIPMLLMIFRAAGHE